jgi:hypothetical protein
LKELPEQYYDNRSVILDGYVYSYTYDSSFIERKEFGKKAVLKKMPNLPQKFPVASTANTHPQYGSQLLLVFYDPFEFHIFDVNRQKVVRYVCH